MAGSVDPLVQDIGVCLLGAGLLAVAFERLRLPHVAAFLGAGVLVGPVGLSLVTDPHNIETIAHLGLTLLLFTIGLELDLRGLLASGRALLVGGLLQVPLSILAGFAVFTAIDRAGLLAQAGPWAALYLGIACAFSSTLLVVKLLQQTLRLDTVSGRMSVGLLIFQDIWAILLLAVQPNLEAPELGPIATTFAGIALLAAFAAFAARYVLPGAFRLVALHPELLVTAALAWCFGLGLLGAHLGRILGLLGATVEVSVSLEMGALIAGASIATFPYAYDVVGKIANLRDFFVTLFFVALGLGIPRPDGALVLGLVAAIGATLLLVRVGVFVPLLALAGLDRRHALETAAILAQGSEFCLVIAFLGQGLGHVDQDLVTGITLAFAASAIATPAIFAQADRLEPALGPALERLGWRAGDGGSQAPGEGDAPRLVLLGFHRVASALIHDLARSHPDLLDRTLVVDLNVAIHPAIRAAGARVVYGDVSNTPTLRHAGVDRAEMLVSTVPDDLLKGTSNLAIARSLRALAPRATIVVNATRAADVPKLREAGADYVYLAHVETSLGLWAALDAALNGELGELVAAREVSHGPVEARNEVL